MEFHLLASFAHTQLRLRNNHIGSLNPTGKIFSTKLCPELLSLRAGPLPKAKFNNFGEKLEYTGSQYPICNIKFTSDLPSLLDHPYRLEGVYSQPSNTYLYRFSLLYRDKIIHSVEYTCKYPWDLSKITYYTLLEPEKLQKRLSPETESQIHLWYPFTLTKQDTLLTLEDPQGKSFTTKEIEDREDFGYQWLDSIEDIVKIRYSFAIRAEKENFRQQVIAVLKTVFFCSEISIPKLFNEMASRKGTIDETDKIEEVWTEDKILLEIMTIAFGKKLLDNVMLANDSLFKKAYEKVVRNTNPAFEIMDKFDRYLKCASTSLTTPPLPLPSTLSHLSTLSLTKYEQNVVINQYSRVVDIVDGGVDWGVGDAGRMGGGIGYWRCNRVGGVLEAVARKREKEIVIGAYSVDDRSGVVKERVHGVAAYSIGGNKIVQEYLNAGQFGIKLTSSDSKTSQFYLMMPFTCKTDESSILYAGVQMSGQYLMTKVHLSGGDIREQNYPIIGQPYNFGPISNLIPVKTAPPKTAVLLTAQDDLYYMATTPSTTHKSALPEVQTLLPLLQSLQSVPIYSEDLHTSDTIRGAVSNNSSLLFSCVSIHVERVDIYLVGLGEGTRAVGKTVQGEGYDVERGPGDNVPWAFGFESRGKLFQLVMFSSRAGQLWSCSRERLVKVRNICLGRSVMSRAGKKLQSSDSCYQWKQVLDNNILWLLVIEKDILTFSQFKLNL